MRHRRATWSRETPEIKLLPGRALVGASRGAAPAAKPVVRALDEAVREPSRARRGSGANEDPVAGLSLVVRGIADALDRMTTPQCASQPSRDWGPASRGAPMDRGPSRRSTDGLPGW